LDNEVDDLWMVDEELGEFPNGIREQERLMKKN
jgi:hypothetical protein